MVPNKYWAFGIDLSQWMGESYNFDMIQFGGHHCGHCAMGRITLLGVGLVIRYHYGTEDN